MLAQRYVGPALTKEKGNHTSVYFGLPGWQVSTNNYKDGRSANRPSANPPTTRPQYRYTPLAVAALAELLRRYRAYVAGPVLVWQALACAVAALAARLHLLVWMRGPGSAPAHPPPLLLGFLHCVSRCNACAHALRVLDGWACAHHLQGLQGLPGVGLQPETLADRLLLTAFNSSIGP
eukprot:1156777-Pelagomonas_calceolata.AAC.6